MIQAILTDIEGTTSSLSFVKDVLFPYARQHVADFVQSHGRDTEVRHWLDEVAVVVGRSMTDAEVVAQLLLWMTEDKKITSLKALQGLIWQEGYQRGGFTGHVYEDAARRLREWQAQGLRTYVYSSGSVHAQKLLFSYSDHGDLTPLFSGYFDTNVGAKLEAESYRRIAAAVGLAPSRILFLSDIQGELDAARSVGMDTRWLVRGGVPDPAAVHQQVRDFDQIAFHTAS